MGSHERNDLFLPGSDDSFISRSNLMVDVGSTQLSADAIDGAFEWKCPAGL